jgi:hypothetical protein
MKFKLFFLIILVSSIYNNSFGMETNTADALVLFSASYATTVARAYSNKYALKLLTNTESDVQFDIAARCVARKPVPQDSIKTALVYAFRPLAGAAVGAATYALPSLINAASQNILSPETQEIIKETGKLVIAANLLYYIPLCYLSFKTDGYEIIECIRAIKNRRNNIVSHQQ